MHPRLKEILEEKKKEIIRLKKKGLNFPDIDLPPTRDFKKAISVPGNICLIAEIKFASPSAGAIRAKTDPVSIGRIYEDAGASAISFLTDSKFFKGDLGDLPALKKAVNLPILRKDFIMDEIQVREAFHYGADAILLIARILSSVQLKDLIDQSLELGLIPLTEIHDMEDLEKAMTYKAEVVGINNRDLDSFEVDTNRTLELAPAVPRECVIVCESGINGERDIEALKGAGVQAVLVGSSLMKSSDIGRKTKEIVKAGYGG